jgi:hypothetical protein
MPSRWALCCVSTRPPGVTLNFDAPGVTKADEEVLRAELAGLKMSGLRRRARETGVSDAQVEHAGDSDDERAALAELIVELECSLAQSGVDTAAEETLRAELTGLKMSVLRKRARGAGATEEQVDEAGDSHDEQAALIEMVVERESGSASALVQAQAKADEEVLRAELAGLKMSGLRRRARGSCVTSEQLDDAGDSYDERAALVELIVKFEGQKRSGADPVAAKAKADEDALRAELAVLKLSGLRKRAKQAAASEEQLDQAGDSEDETAKLTQMIVELVRSQKNKGVSAEKQEGMEADLGAELSRLRPSALQDRALLFGASSEQVKAALDDVDVKQALLALCVAFESGGAETHSTPVQPPTPLKDAPTTTRPHYGSANTVDSSSTGTRAPARVNASSREMPSKVEGRKARSVLPAGKHVMLSYSWSTQARVTRVRKLLQQQGVTCWMDIDGGMQRDIYVSNSAQLTA